MNIINISFVILILLNTLSFGLMFVDQKQALKKSERVPEIYLFLSAICFASLGIQLAMIFLRHKIKKWYFNLGIFLLLIQQIFIIYQIYTLFR